MDRIFHARIPLYMYFFIALVGALALLFLWTMMPLCGLVMLLLLIVAIERVIHTTYTITTDGFLIISHGRFQQKKELSLQDVKRVEKLRSFRIGRFCLVEYLLVFYGNEKHVTVMPVKETEFLETLQKRKGR